MPMYNFIEYSDAHSKISGSLWQYHRNELALDDNKNTIDFPANNNNSNSFKFKQQITGQTGNRDAKYVGIMVPLKYLSNFWITLEMYLIHCEIALQLTCSKKSILVAGAKLLQQIKYPTLE